MRPYTVDEVLRLVREYPEAVSAAEVARKMGREASNVRNLARSLGLKLKPKPEKPRRMPAATRDALIRSEYPTAKLADLARLIGITEGSLRQYAYRLGVKRADTIMREARVRGGVASVAVRRRNACVLATPLDAAWRGLAA